MKRFKGITWKEKALSELKFISSQNGVLSIQVVGNIFQPCTNCELYLKLNLRIKICIAEPPAGSHRSSEKWHLAWHWRGGSSRADIAKQPPSALQMSGLYSNIHLKSPGNARWVRNWDGGLPGVVRIGVFVLHTRVESILQTSVKTAYCWCHKLCHFSASC